MTAEQKIWKKRVHVNEMEIELSSSCNVEASPLKSIYRVHTKCVCDCLSVSLCLFFEATSFLLLLYLYHKCRYVLCTYTLSDVLYALHEANRNYSIPQKSYTCLCAYGVCVQCVCTQNDKEKWGKCT